MLTDKQQNVLNIITDFVSKYAKSPTIEELQHLLSQKSKRGVVQYLEALEKKGFITRSSTYRGIRLGNSVGLQTMLSIPVLGVANAGKALSYAYEHDYGTMPISKKLISGNKEDYFIVKIDGTSMNEYLVNGKYISNGSYVLVDKKQKNINSQDAFLFIIDGSATVKIPKKEGEYLYLLPKSKDEHHRPIILTNEDNIEINGKIIDVFNF
ncbi:MAG: hypothetical protein NWP80_00375 [Candidatus Gracilibacteria bacterium]|nr:hypothetical protein [Candidatus Gracilibacteria bacterium]